MLRTEQRPQPRIIARIAMESVGPTKDLSKGGMCMLVADPLRDDMIVTLSFNLPDDMPITCRAKVEWCRVSKIDPDLFEVGLQFTEISDACRKAVADFVDEYLPKEETPKAASGPRDPHRGYR